MTQAGLSAQYRAEIPFSAVHAMDERVHLCRTEKYFNLAKEEINFLFENKCYTALSSEQLPFSLLHTEG